MSIKSKHIKTRLEYLRGELRAERISYGELAELQSLAAWIDQGDVELLEAAGVPEFPTVEPYAMATIGEQVFDFTYEQIAKFKPGGANFRRLRDLQAAGEALRDQATLYAAAPALAEALQILLETRCFRNDLSAEHHAVLDKARAALALAKETK
jgi:hypothetical protein